MADKTDWQSERRSRDERLDAGVDFVVVSPKPSSKAKRIARLEIA